jgi:hypothetical protein
VRGDVIANALGAEGFGGTVELTTGNGTVDVSGTVDAAGPAFGGTVSLFSFDAVRVSGTLVNDGANSFGELVGATSGSWRREARAWENGTNRIAASGPLTVVGTPVAGAANRSSSATPRSRGS